MVGLLLGFYKVPCSGTLGNSVGSGEILTGYESSILTMNLLLPLAVSISYLYTTKEGYLDNLNHDNYSISIIF
jgi:hypothetical protein